MKRMFVISMAVSLLLALPGLGFAGLTGSAPTTIFEQMDAKGDKVIDPAELKAYIQSNYVKMDINKDGKVSKEEFMADDFTPMDTNKDGAIELDEYLNFWLGKIK